MNKLLILLILITIGCKQVARENTASEARESNKEVSFNSSTAYLDFFDKNPDYISQGFDFPVGKPDAKGYYNAQPFMKNNHLGDDWNAVTGGNSDLGKPIYAIGNGIVSEVQDYGGGWGNILRIVHQLPSGELRESLYAHCQEVFVTEKEAIIKGQKIATIGNVDGLYYAHLHLEVRWKINADLGSGYSSDTSGYMNPTDFIKQFRKVK